MTQTEATHSFFLGAEVTHLSAPNQLSNQATNQEAISAHFPTKPTAPKMKLSDYVKLVEKDLLAAMNNIISGEVSSKATMTASDESSSPIPLTLMLQQLRELAFRSNSTELLLVDPHINNQI